MAATLVEHNLAYCISKVTDIASKVKMCSFKFSLQTF